MNYLSIFGFYTDNIVEVKDQFHFDVYTDAESEQTHYWFEDDDIIYRVQSLLRNIGDNIIASIFENINSYYEYLPLTPVFVSECGLSPESSMTPQILDKGLKIYSVHPEYIKSLSECTSMIFMHFHMV